jgi:hypothetical protein
MLRTDLPHARRSSGSLQVVRGFERAKIGLDSVGPLRHKWRDRNRLGIGSDLVFEAGVRELHLSIQQLLLRTTA